ncbi:MAG TPA: YeeE/YedE family protein [Azospirillaceae bacterium]|nr:YeeE/YedE family protein [Azospirillaceae bacterium]
MDLQQILSPAVFGPPLIGGALIGLAAAVLAVFNGRVAGVSGVIAGAARLTAARLNVEDRGWRLAFIAGLLAAPLLYALFDPAGWETGPLAASPVLAVAGLLVGVGAGVGSGCTSGHGVCGLARGSLRSLASVATFMAAAAATVFFVRHVVGG